MQQARDVAGQVVVELDLQYLHVPVVGAHRGQAPVEQVHAGKTGAQVHVKGDAHVLRRVQVGLPGVVHDHLRAQQPGAHLHEHVLQQRVLGFVQPGGVARDQLVAQPPGDLDAGFLDQVAQLALALQEDGPVRQVVDADAVLVAVHHARLLVVKGGILHIVKVQRANEVGFAADTVGVHHQRPPQPLAQGLQLRRVDEVFQLVPRRQSVSLELHTTPSPN